MGCLVSGPWFGGQTDTWPVGLFLYIRRALWNDDMSAPPGPVFPASSRLTVFTPIVGVREVGRGDSVGDAPAG